MPLSHNLKAVNHLIVIIFASKVLRNIKYGTMSTLLLHFYFRNVYFEAAQNIALSWASILLAGLIKSVLLLKVAQKFGTVNVMSLGYVLQLITLIFINMRDLYAYGTHIIYSLVFSIGFLSPLGEETGPFENIQVVALKHIFTDKFFGILKIYNRLGYISQAVGSISIIIFYFSLQESFYQNYLIHKFLAFTFCINVVSFVLSFIINLKLKISDHFQKNTVYLPLNNEKLSLSTRVKAHYLVEGFCLGLISAPFVVYFSETKLNFYYHKVGILMAVFFLFKGIGRQVFQYSTDFRFVFKKVFLLTLFTLIIASMSHNSLYVMISLILVFPFWHYGQTKLDKMSQHLKQYSLSSLNVWEGIGSVIGLASSAYFMSFLHYGPHMTHIFLIYSLTKLTNMSFIEKYCSDQKFVCIQQNIQLDPNVNSPDYLFGQNEDKDKEVQKDSQQSKKVQIRKKWISVFLMLLFLATVMLFFAVTVNQNYYKLRYARDDFSPSTDLKLYNQSLARYLIRQNITKINLLKCNQGCIQQYKTKKKGYNLLQYQQDEPEWLHFARSSYYQDKQDVINQLKAINNLKINGFSMFWDNVLRFHKMQRSIYQFIFSFAQNHGFYYQEMPSLNLRAIQAKIVLIFSRSKRIPMNLPPFVQQPPPKNYLAFQTTFKMVTNLPHLREFIIYHLKVGVDKFFLYDNDQPINSHNFFNEHRIGDLLPVCLSYHVSSEYKIFNEIWQQFYDHIIYIPWRIDTGHPHAEARQNYFLYFKQVTKYTSFTDLDEYLFSPSGQYVPNILSRLQKEYNIGMIVVMSRQFQHRICLENGQLGLEQYKWTPLHRLNITRKVIIMNELIVKQGLHGRSIKSGDYTKEYDARHDLRMNHYKLTTSAISPNEFKQVFTDDTMKAFVEDIKASCRGKCSDSFISSCSPDRQLKDLCSMGRSSHK